VGAVRYRGLRVYTNLPPCGAMRGHGAVNVRFAFESLLDEAAEALGLDPFALRRANLITPPYRTLNDLQVNSYGLPQCLDKVERASDWRERRAAGPVRPDCGRAAAARAGAGLLALRLRLGQAGALERRAARGDPPQARLRRQHHDPDRRRRHRPGLVDAADADRRRGAAAADGAHPRRRHRQRADAQGQRLVLVARVLHGRQRRAARRRGAATVLVEAAAKLLGVAPDQVEWEGERCQVACGEAALDFAQVVQAALVDSGTLTVKGAWSTPPRPRAARSAAPRSGPAPASRTRRQVVEVEVDEAPARCACCTCGWRTTAAARSTRWRSRARCRARCGWAWARRCAEQTNTTRACRCGPTSSTTGWSTIVESPPIDVTLVESMDPLGPFGAKEASEGGLHSVPPAVAAAVHDAVGLRLRALPMTPERVLEALQQRRREHRLAAARAARAAAGGAAAGEPAATAATIDRS
jgi:4-hydroxybenzoyl-CoA reductase subunit alpha